jgi:hypothetical protein
MRNAFTDCKTGLVLQPDFKSTVDSVPQLTWKTPVHGAFVSLMLQLVGK